MTQALRFTFEQTTYTTLQPAQARMDVARFDTVSVIRDFALRHIGEPSPPINIAMCVLNRSRLPTMNGWAYSLVDFTTPMQDVPHISATLPVLPEHNWGHFIFILLVIDMWLDENEDVNDYTPGSIIFAADVRRLRVVNGVCFGATRIEDIFIIE